MRTKEYIWIIKHNHKEKTKESEIKLQKLFDRVVKEMLNENPQLLDTINDTKTG